MPTLKEQLLLDRAIYFDTSEFAEVIDILDNEGTELLADEPASFKDNQNLTPGAGRKKGSGMVSFSLENITFPLVAHMRIRRESGETWRIEYVIAQESGMISLSIRRDGTKFFKLSGQSDAS